MEFLLRNVWPKNTESFTPKFKREWLWDHQIIVLIINVLELTMIQNKFKKKNCLFFLLTLESVALIKIQEIRLSNIQKMSLCNKKKKKQIYQIYSIFITLHRLHLIRKTKLLTWFFLGGNYAWIEEYFFIASNKLTWFFIGICFQQISRKPAPQTMEDV